MKYKGYILGSVTPVINAGVNPGEEHYFSLIGFWLYRNNKKIGSYVLTNERGEKLEELKHLQFRRSRTNEFYLESIG